MSDLSRWIAGCALAALVGGAAPAQAGLLRSAAFSTSTNVVPGIGTPAFTVTSGAASGSLVGSQFSLDAGDLFLGQTTLPVTAPNQAPVTAIRVNVVQNGALTGALSGTSFLPTGTPPRGVTGTARIRGKVGGVQQTLLQIPFAAGAGGILHTTAPGLAASVFAQGWGFAPVTFTSTRNLAPVGTVMLSGGGVSVTPSGDTHVTLVTLNRVRVRGLATYSVGIVQALRLTYAPEPAAVPLLAGASAAFALGRRVRRRSRRRG